MKVCKTCKGKGWIFVKGTIFTGKYTRLMGFDMPVTTDGMEKATCNKCFGKGTR